MLRAFPDLGQRVWGARTLSDDTRWRYVNVRRLFLFIEESIDEGMQWVVFEPNAEQLWASVRQSISSFLTRSGGPARWPAPHRKKRSTSSATGPR